MWVVKKGNYFSQQMKLINELKITLHKILKLMNE